MQEGYTITNKFVRPEETIELTVNKIWVDNETQVKRRPSSIVINVKAENADGKTAEDIIDSKTIQTEVIIHQIRNSSIYKLTKIQ